MRAKAVAKSLGLAFRHVQVTPDISPSDVTGVPMATRDPRNSTFALGQWCPGFHLLMKFNGATPKTRSSLLEAMEDDRSTDGVMILAVAVLSHRTTVNPAARTHNIDTRDIIQEVVHTLQVPGARNA